MNMPGFTAEASIHEIDKFYRGVGLLDVTKGGQEILPQALDSACYAECMTWLHNRAFCLKVCRFVPPV
jgi:hypothetical protein